MFPIAVNAYYADQGGPTAFEADYEFTRKPCQLAHLSAFNKGASTVYIELYDTNTGAADGTPRLLPCPPDTLVYWSQLRMHNGIFVQAVDQADGGALIGNPDVKFDCAFMETMA